MDTKTMNRTSGPKFGTRMALLASAAVLSVTFTASTATAAPRAEVSYSKAQKALAKGKVSKAITHAETAVQSEPRNAAYRALLGKAYLEAGRYNSASKSYGEAIELGDQTSRTVLSYALTQTAIGGGRNALDTLKRFERVLDPADLGLAMALAGNPERGVFVLTNTLRAGQNTAKVRQNLAYTYALAGNWRAARVMAAEDVPADQLDARLSQWASNAKPEDHMVRVSTLLGIAPAGDQGMPAALALTNFPSPEQLMAEAKAAEKAKPVQVAKAPSQPVKAPKAVAKAPKPVPAVAKAPAASKPLAKAPAVASAQPSAKALKGVPAFAKAPVQKPAQSVAAKPAAKPVSATVKAIASATQSPVPKPVSAKSSAKKEAWGSSKTQRTARRSSKGAQATTPRFVSQPVTQQLPASAAPQRVAALPKKAPMPANAAPKRVAPKPVVKAPKGDSHMVQLGSYSTEAEAKAGWASLQRKFGQLAAHDVVITKAEVKGKTYYRIAAAGFGGKGAAQMCSTVRSSGRGCFAYVKTSPPKGAIGKGTRIAAATPR